MAQSLNTVQSGLMGKAHAFSEPSPNIKSFAKIEAILSQLNSERNAAHICTSHGSAAYSTVNKSLNGYNSLIAAIPLFDCTCKNVVSPCTCNAENCTCVSDSVCGSKTTCTCNTECTCDIDCSCDTDSGTCPSYFACSCNSYGYPCPSDGGCSSNTCSSYSCNPFVGCLCDTDGVYQGGGCGVNCSCNSEYGCVCEGYCTSEMFTCPTYVAACTCNPQVQTCPCNSKYN